MLRHSFSEYTYLHTFGTRVGKLCWQAREGGGCSGVWGFSYPPNFCDCFTKLKWLPMTVIKNIFCIRLRIWLPPINIIVGCHGRGSVMCPKIHRGLKSVLFLFAWHFFFDNEFFFNMHVVWVVVWKRDLFMPVYVKDQSRLREVASLLNRDINRYRNLNPSTKRSL